jgi:hypothetical protein
MTSLTLALALAASAQAAPSPDRVPAAVPWLPGEAMDYTIDYIGITMGKARIAAGARDGDLMPISLASRTAGLGAIVTFKQTLVSNLDVFTLLPASSVLEATEPGGYHHVDTSTFDRAAGKAAVKVVARAEKNWEVDIGPEAVDFVALVFQLRTLPLPDGGTHEFQVLAGRKVNKVVTTVVGRESLKVDAGRFATVKVRVPTGFDGKFSEKNPTFVWFSDDARRVVVKISADFAIGRANAELDAYQPGKPPPAAPPTPPAEPGSPGADPEAPAPAGGG